jgi:glycosyltransferase involved in cell wall biosynthesis
MTNPAPTPSTKLRILHIIPGTETAPATIHARRNVNDLANRGVINKTFYLTSRTRPVLIFREWLRFRRELRSFRPNIVHAQYGTVTAMFAALSTTQPLVMTFRGAELNPEPDISFYRQQTGHLLTQCAALRADKIICVSDMLKRRLWWRKDRVIVIPSGVNPDVFYPEPRPLARNKLGWSSDEPVVLFNEGGNPQTKGLDLAIESMEKAREYFGPIRLEILSGGVNPNLIPTYLNASDCLLSTSRFEGAPTLVREAMACNLPVISVDVADVAARVARVDNCEICERDPDNLAQAIVAVLRSRRRSDGRKHISEFTNDVCCDRLVQAYNDCKYARQRRA